MEKNNTNFKKMAIELNLSEKYLRLILANDQNIELYELKEIYESLEKHNRKVILDNWNTIALKKAKRIDSIYQAKNVYHNTLTSSKAHKIASKKWQKYSRLEIKKAKNFNEIFQAYGSSPPGSKEKMDALLKWIRISKTCAEIKLIFNETQENNNKKTIVLKKWYNLAKSKDEILDLYNHAIGTKFEIAILKKLKSNFK